MITVVLGSLVTMDLLAKKLFTTNVYCLSLVFPIILTILVGRILALIVLVPGHCFEFT